MRFHLPHARTTLSPHIDLPHVPPRRAGFYATPPQASNADASALAVCNAPEASPHGSAAFAKRVQRYRQTAKQRQRWNVYHWPMWDLQRGRERTPRVPHLFRKLAEEEGSSRMVRCGRPMRTSPRAHTHPSTHARRQGATGPARGRTRRLPSVRTRGRSGSAFYCRRHHVGGLRAHGPPAPPSRPPRASGRLQGV